MTDVTAKLAESLRLMLGQFCNPAITRYDLKLRDQAREALAAYEAAQAMSPKSVSGTSEPVAWRLKSPPGSTYTAVFNPGKPDAQTLEYWGRNGGEIEYAYAAPVAQVSQQAAPEPRKPLAEGQIDELLERERMKWSARSGPPTYEFAISFARAIEAAHGIKENKAVDD